MLISDTHNHQPDLPPGDIPIHAGDRTENGSFDEVQAQLNWLSAQPHAHKIVVSGSRNVLLDEAFLEKYPERRYGQSKTRHDLDWGSVTYLCNESITLALDVPASPNHQGIPMDTTTSKKRSLKIYGSPYTPQYGISAFQYPRDEDVWAGKIRLTRISSLSMGRPNSTLIRATFTRAGCRLLGQEVGRVRPRLVVFGHIHAAYGTEDVVMDAVRQRYEEVMGNWGGWGTLMLIAVYVLCARMKNMVVGRERMVQREKVTTFVNASIVGGSRNEVQNQPIVLEYYDP